MSQSVLTRIQAQGDVRLPNGLYAKNPNITFDPTAVSLTEGRIDCVVYINNGENPDLMNQALFTLPVSVNVADLPQSAQMSLLGVLFPALQQQIKTQMEAQQPDVTFSIE